MISRGLVALIKLYRKYLSGLKSAPSCRFTPSCSRYAIDALTEWGAVCGLILALWRLLRCNPFSKGGYDPVPRCPFRRRRDDADICPKDAQNHNKGN